MNAISVLRGVLYIGRNRILAVQICAKSAIYATRDSKNMTHNAAITGDFTVSCFAHKIGRSPCAKRLMVKLSGSLPCYEATLDLNSSCSSEL